MLDPIIDDQVIEEPDVSHLVTEDDEPVDSIFSERQMKLICDCLETSYKPGVPFISLANVGLFHLVEEPPVVPDVLLSLEVVFPTTDIHAKKNRSYFVWRYGKPPDLVVEIVSNREGGEDTRKVEHYQRLHVSYYLICDPDGHLSKRPLRLFELKGTRYVEFADPMSPLESLGLKPIWWDGEYGKYPARYLRFTDLEGNLLLTGQELAAQTRLEADRAKAEADRAKVEAEEAIARATRLAEQLRQAGLDPEKA
ncbi:MAG: Uma2 family endonuclease [Vulcanimicrobiota bacterium]